MVSTAYVYIWRKRVGAVAWNSTTGLASFEYDPKFPLEHYPIAPIQMPSKNNVYSFPAHRDTETFKGLPGLLAAILTGRYGKELINNGLPGKGDPNIR